MDTEAYDENIMDRMENKRVLQMVQREREIINTLKSRQKRWIGHMLRRFIIENNIRMTNSREEGLCETKNSVLGLVTEDEGAVIGYEELKILAYDTPSW